MGSPADYVSRRPGGLGYLDNPLGRMRDNKITNFLTRAGIPTTALEGDQALTENEVRDAISQSNTPEARILLACFNDYASNQGGSIGMTADNLAAFLKDTENGTTLIGTPKARNFLRDAGIDVTRLTGDRGLTSDMITASPDDQSAAGRLAKYFNFYAVNRSGGRYMTAKDVLFFMKTTDNGISEPEPWIQTFWRQGLDRSQSTSPG